MTKHCPHVGTRTTRPLSLNGSNFRLCWRCLLAAAQHGLPVRDAHFDAFGRD